MSLWTKARGLFTTAAAVVAAPYTGGASLALMAAYNASKQQSLMPMMQAGGGGDIYPVGARMGSTPGAGMGGGVLRALPGAIGYGAGVVVGRARAIARGAAALCAKHPQWCSTIGGVAAVAGMMESGQLPVPKRRRGRGLTPRDLRSFRRVARLIRVFAPTVRRIPHRALHVRGTGITHA
jgi:hypothetical protein